MNINQRIHYVLKTALLCCLASNLLAAEEPSYEILVQDDRFEIRQYETMIVAEVSLEGDAKEVSKPGFKLLVDYVFGDNTPQQASSTKDSQKIKMTVPVTREQTADDAWRIAFFMPSKWNLNTLPQPNNDAVVLRELPPRTMAAIRFSGRWKEQRYVEKRSELESWLAAKGYSLAGRAQYAAYNPPWSLPAFRRNEVIIPVQAI